MARKTKADLEAALAATREDLAAARKEVARLGRVTTEQEISIQEYEFALEGYRNMMRATFVTQSPGAAASEPDEEGK